MKKILLLLLISSFSFAQNVNRKFESYKESNDILEIKTSDGMYLIKPYSDKIIETSFVPKNEQFNPISHAVILDQKKGISKVSETPTSINYTTNGISVTIQKSPFKISYLYKDKELVSEKMDILKRFN